MDVKFLSDLYMDKTQPVALTNLLSSITTRDGSHKGGWTRLLKCQLENIGFSKVKILDNFDSLHNFGMVIFDLGAEYSGTLNMFGGLDEKVFKRLNEIREFKGNVYSWRHSLPNLSVLSNRRNNKSSCEAFKETTDTFLSEVNQVLAKCQVFEHAYVTDKVLIGDSHTPSVWTPEYMIERQDGRTLYRAIKDQTIERIVSELKSVKNVTIHMSNIDVRHHICRQPHPEMSAIALAESLCDQLNSIRELFRLNEVSICHTVGIEDVSRELPKTGYYKGSPYFGSWELRNNVRNIYNASIDDLSKQHKFNVIEFPSYFFDDYGKLKFKVMEVPASVHLSPAHYRWDLNENINRWIHEEGR